MEIDAALPRLIAERRAGFVVLPRTPGGRVMPIRQAMVAPLVGESGVIGLFTIANRLTEGTEFGADDLRLLETLANQAGVALENGQLEQSLADCHAQGAASLPGLHDPDGPAEPRPVHRDGNDASPTRVGQARPIPLLDLDDFRTSNDTINTPPRRAAGGQMSACAPVLRGDDLAALGWAVTVRILITTTRRRRAVALAGAPDRRHVDGLPGPRPRVVVGVSIGIAMSRGAGSRPGSCWATPTRCTPPRHSAGAASRSSIPRWCHDGGAPRAEHQLTRGIGRSVSSPCCTNRS
jgi:hypothetical protein